MKVLDAIKIKGCIVQLKAVKLPLKVTLTLTRNALKIDKAIEEYAACEKEIQERWKSAPEGDEKKKALIDGSKELETLQSKPCKVELKDLEKISEADLKGKEVAVEDIYSLVEFGLITA